MLPRRVLLFVLLAGWLSGAAAPVFAASGTIRVGYQKYGTLILLKARGGLKERLKPLGFSVTWTEFPGGPQLLEAMNAGAIDFGSTGEAPPIFAQAAGTALTYVAHEPAAPRGEAILVSANSPIRSVADLKGKSVALNKGSNVHYLLVRALEKAGLGYADVKPVFLAPADGRAAFERGSVDAWAIWDPYFAAGQAGTGGRVLTDGEGLVPNVQFYLAGRGFAADNRAVVDTVLDAVGEVDRWAGADLPAAADLLGAAMHVPTPIVLTALARQTFGVARMSDDVACDQQRVADTFFSLGILPRPVSIADALPAATN